MAKTKLQVGSDVDLLSGPEYAAGNDKVIAAVVGLRQAPIIIRHIKDVTTDANGNVGGGASGPGDEIFRVPQGMRCDIQRVSLSAPGFTPAAPLTSGWLTAGADIGSAAPMLFWPGAGTTVLPSLWTDGDAANVLDNGQRLMVIGAGLPASLDLTFLLQIRQWYDYPRQTGERRF
jgi:hypothetical protein